MLPRQVDVAFNRTGITFLIFSFSAPWMITMLETNMAIFQFQILIYGFFYTQSYHINIKYSSHVSISCLCAFPKAHLGVLDKKGLPSGFRIIHQTQR